MPSSGGHPDPGLLAAHAERRLAGAEAAQLDAHLADCSTCYETFAETVQFLLAEEPAEEPAPAPARVLPFHRRPAFQIAAGLAAAAGLVLAVHQLWRARPQQGGPLVAELAQAMGPTRFIEPRLTGGFQHGRLVVMRSGNATQGLDAQSPAVLTAVASIRQRTQNDTSPAALAALAATYLVSGDVAAAVKALESATAQDPENPRLQSDLAAAYLVRASRLDEPSDLPKALEAAEKSIEKKDAPLEAWFNRALALEGLHLIDQAKKAWNDYLERDSTSPWAAEAKKRRDELPPAQQSTLEEDRARARATLEEGKPAVEALADESPAILRDYFDNVLLNAWADAYLAADPKAAGLKGHAELIGDALLRTTGDAMPRDAAVALSALPSGPSRDPPRTQALGYKALHEAQGHYDLQQPACDSFRRARHLLDEGGSPFSAWTRERVVVACSNVAQPQDSLMELAGIEALAAQHGYRWVIGRVHWMQALLHLGLGGFGESLDRYRLAREDFRTLRDPENEANVLTRLAHSLQEAGESRSAWRERVRALALLEQVRRPASRYVHLWGATVACSYEQLPRTTLHMTESLVELARQGARPAYLGEALVRRSMVLHDLSSDDRAAADLAEARRWIAQVDVTAYMEVLSAQADTAEGRLFAGREPERAAAALSRARGYYERSLPALVPGVQLLLARAEAARGLDDAAEAELLEGIRLLETQQHQALEDAQLQAAFFDRGASLFDEMVTFQIDNRHNPLRALSFVERGRARRLLDSLRAERTPSRAQVDPVGKSDATAHGIEAVQRELPTGTALVYYECLSDRLLSWVVTRDAIHFVGQKIDRDDLRQEVAAFDAALTGRAAVSFVRRPATILFDRLIRPLSAQLRGQRALILVPDEVLQRVSFASLWDEQTGRFLVEDHLVGIAPSGSVFVHASKATTGGSRNGALALLAVGNPRFDRRRWAGLPVLPEAESEAVEIARLYEHVTLLTGAEATKDRFLDGARSSRVVHYAGHALADETASHPRLLLASSAGTADSGALDLSELDRNALRHTRLVVLAGCRTAAGTVSRTEGALSLARPLLAAGVPNVVASLWDVDDAVSRRFFVAFHRALLADGEPLLALQRTQIAFLHDPDSELAQPATWAGFLAIGGLEPRESPRAVVHEATRPL